MPIDNVEEESQSYGAAQATERNARLFRNWTSLEKQYEPWKALYQEIADYIAPGRGRFPDSESIPNQKTKAASRVINPAAADALHMLGAGLHGGLSSPARPWFQLGFQDPEVDKYSAGRKWLEDCEKILYGVLRRSNFYSIIHNVYEETGGFGTGCLFVDQHPQHVVNFSYFTAGDYRFSINELSKVHSLYRKIRLQIHQMAAMFGKENLSDTCKRLLETNPYEWRDVLHCIEPNPEVIEGSTVKTKMPFRSVYAEWKEMDRRLLDSGYMEMPVVCPRWQALSSEAYGWGPGPEALGISKALQRMEMNAMLAEDLFLQPPMGVPSGFQDRMLDLSPGAKNVYDKGKEGSRAFEPLIEINPQAVNFYEQKLQAVETKIRRLFFNELFLMIASTDQRMTATEVAARNEEKMIMIGPCINRLLYEMLDPILERTFNLCARASMLPPPPPDIANAEYKIEYISILAQAQKLVNAQSVQAYVQLATAMAAIDPTSIDKTNSDKLLESYGDIINLPFGIVREQDETDELRQRKADEMARQQQALEAQQGADTLQKLGNADMSEESALGQLEKAMGTA